MVFATTYPYHRRQHSFTAADQMGSAVVHTELLRHALAGQIVESACLVRAALSKEELAAFAELRDEFGPERVKVLGGIEYLKAVSPRDSILVLKAPASALAAQSRQALGGRLAPTCSLVHSVNWPNLLIAHVGLILTQSPFDALVVPSLAAKKALLSAAGQALGFIRDRLPQSEPRIPFRVEQIPFGIEPRPFAGIDRAGARSLLGFSQDEVIVLYFGRLSCEQKADLEPLLRVVHELIPRHPHLRLVVAGHDTQGGYRGVLETLAQSLGIQRHVTFITDVSPPIKPLIYASADVFVSPVDNIQESYGISLLEAMAAGLPVVASDWSGYREIVRHGVTGFLVRTYWNGAVNRALSWIGPLGTPAQLEALLAQSTTVDTGPLRQALECLIQDADLRVQMGREGQRRIDAEYSWAASCRRFGALWKSQLEEYSAGNMSQPPGACLDWGAMFSNYATQWLGPQAVLQRTAYGSQLLHASIPANSVSRVQRVLQIVEDPISLEELARHTEKAEMDCVGWLLKKNALAIVSETANGHS